MNERLRVGELAERVGLSVRTLHHYDEIGLLRPAGHTGSGHRLYGEQELQRLQRILSLKQLGLSLEEIQRSLDEPGFSTLEVLERHLGVLVENIAHQERLRHHLSTIVTRLRDAKEVSGELLLQSIEETIMFEKYYTPEQMEALKKRAALVGDARIQQVQEEWQEIFAALAEEKAKGSDPKSEAMQALARRAKGLIAEFTGGDPGIERSLGKLYRGEGSSKVLGPHQMGASPEAFQALNEAMEALTDR